MAARPVLFTVEFRREMARMSPRQRQQWLSELARRLDGPEDVVGRERAEPPELREVARACRLGLVDAIEKKLGPFDEAHRNALLEVPREHFVRKQDIPQSADDTPLPLDASGLATISAPHAYLLSYRLLKLAPGDALVELGTGSGYGAALAAHVVGPEGRVATFEIDPALAAWARETLRGDSNVNVIEGDATSSTRQWRGAPKVVVAFAIGEIPATWLEVLPVGGRLVAPVGHDEQRLVLVERQRRGFVKTDHGAVRYVKNRSR